MLTLLSRPTLVSKSLIPHLPIIYLLPLPPPPPPSLAPGFPSASSPPPDSLRVLQSNAGGLRSRSTKLLHFLSSHPVDLICIQESNLNSSSSFRIPGFSALRSDRTHSRSGIFSSDTTHASGSVVIFVRQGLSFSELSTSSLSLLDPYSDYVGINISLNNSSSVSFLNVYAPLSAPPQQMAEPIPSLPQFFPPPETSLFWGTSIAITSFGTQEVLPTPAGRKYSTGSSPLTSSPSMTLTHPPFSIAPLLTFSLPPLLLLFPAPGRCFRTLVLTTYQFFYLSLSLRSFASTSVPLSFFQKASWDGFVSYIDSHCPSTEEYSSLSSAAALFTSLALNAAKSSIPFSCIKRHPKAWWSAEVESAFSERRKAFTAAHRSDKDCQAYISTSRRASLVIAKAKAEAWQTTCSSLSPKPNPKSVHSLFRSIAGSSSSSPNFNNCFSSTESASVYAAYWIFFFTFSIFPGLRIPFLPSGRHLPLFPSTRWESLSTLLLSSGLSLSPLASQSFLNASFYPVYSSFWNLIPFFLPVRPVSALDGLHLIKFCSFLSPFRMGLANPGRALGRSCLLSISLKLLTLSGIPPFSTN